MEIALPPPVRRSFADPKVLLGFLAFLSVLLRLWATTGELLLAGLAYGFDYRGALGQPDACGVIKGRAGAKESETISRSPPAETPARIISTAQVDAEPRIQESPSTLNIVSDIL
jgi:hypothetical protein